MTQGVWCANLAAKKKETRLHYVINFIQSSGVSFSCFSCVNRATGARGSRRETGKAENWLFMCLALSVTKLFEYFASALPAVALKRKII